MYLPSIYKKFSSLYPEVFKTFEELGIKTREAGPLDRKTQNLIKLGIAVGSSSRGAVMSHTRKAIESGAAEEEILHVLLLTLTTTGFPNMVAAFGWVDEVLQKKQ
jgi:4-carboxymuconolactone decarboxylase